MKINCPKCKSQKEKKLVHYHDGKNHIDGLRGFDLECLDCGLRFLLWESSSDEVKKAYGESWQNYLYFSVKNNKK